MRCRCHPRNRCGACPEAIDERWVAFGLMWWLISFEMTELAPPGTNSRRDDQRWRARVEAAR